MLDLSDPGRHGGRRHRGPGRGAPTSAVRDGRVVAVGDTDERRRAR